jgi:hypothetical protein
MKKGEGCDSLLGGAVLHSVSDMQSEFGMSGQDAIVLPSVIAHLNQHKPIESCFLNRNSKDFDDPDIREMLKVSEAASSS